jgi:hypothetical protein
VAHPLDGARTKVVRASDHLETLDREARRFLDDYAHDLVIEEDPETGDQVIRVRYRRRVRPPERLDVIVGDAVHNLRSALDHVIWQLAIIGRGPGERNQFPVFDTPQQFKSRRNTYLKGVLTKHRTMLETYQPYKRWYGANALQLIVVLNDIDKHRLVHTVRPFALTGPDTLKVTNVRKIDVTAHEYALLEDGAEVYRFSNAEIIDPRRPVNVEANQRFSIAFGGPEFAASRADLLLCRDVVSNIIEDFAGEF